MPRSRQSSFDQSYKAKMELIPLYTSEIPPASRKRLAKHPPTGGILRSQMDDHINEMRTQARAEPIIYVSKTKCRKILNDLELKFTTADLNCFFKELNSALLEYGLRFVVEQTPLSSWFPRFKAIVVLLRKLRALLPDRHKDELLFNIIRHFGEHYAASQGQHPGLPPYELADPLHNFPFLVNYRSDERLDQTIQGVNEVTVWMQRFLDARVEEIRQSSRERMSAAVWLVGLELPRIYEFLFKLSFGVTVSTKRGGPGVRFITACLTAAGILTPGGTGFSAQTIKTYRRRALKYDRRS
jgi:hypothetical protein